MTTPYEITSIEEQFGMNDAGRLVTMKVIHYRTAHGDRGTVSMEKDMYTAEAAQGMIAAEIAENDKLRGIK